MARTRLSGGGEGFRLRRLLEPVEGYSDFLPDFTPVSPFRDTMWERPRHMLGRAVRGDISAAFRATFSPDMLSPTERRGWIPQDDSPMSKVIRGATNPLIILGLVLSLKYPVAKAKNLFAASKAVAGYNKKFLLNPYAKALPPGIWRGLSAYTIFGGTKFGRILERIAESTHTFHTRTNQVWSKAATRAENVMGGAASIGTQCRTAGVLDGLHQPDGRMMRWMRAIWRDSMEAAGVSKAVINQKLGRAGRQILPGGRTLQQDIPATLWQGAKETQEFMWRETMTGMGRARLTHRVKESIGFFNRLDDFGINYHGSHRRKAFLKDLQKTLMEKPPQKISDLMKNATMRQRYFAQLEQKGISITGETAQKGYLEVMREAGHHSMHHLDDYFAHVESHLSLADEAKAAEQYWKRKGLSMDQAAMRRLFGPVDKAMTPGFRRIMEQLSLERNIAPRLMPRRAGMIPNLNDWEQHLGKYFTPETTEMVEALSLLGTEAGTLRFRQYSLRLGAVMEGSAQAMSRNYALAAQGLGPRLTNAFNEMKASPMADPIKVALAQDTYMPLALGKINPTESMHALSWSYWKRRAYDFFGQSQVKETLGKSIAERLQAGIASPMVQDITYRNAGAKLAGWIYQSALGLNPASAGLNLMQNLMTTAGVVGGRHLMSGFGAAVRDIEKTAKIYAKGGKTLSEAFDIAAPHFAKYIGHLSEVEALGAVRRLHVGGKTWRTHAEKAKAVIMSMFTRSEQFNKLWAFHSGRLKGLAEGLDPHFASQIGAKVMKATQYPGGWMGAPNILLKWPAPLRQFLQFPARTFELATTRGLQIGAAELPLRASGRARWNLGTAGRMLLAGGITYEAGQELLDLDLSHGLMFGAMPLPFGPDAPGYPIPFPPAVSTPLGLVGDILEGGEFKRTRQAMPLAVPGGVALARAATRLPVVGEKVAKRLGRSYADYKHVTPDGRVPIFTSQGALKGFRSPLGLFADAIGWRTLTGRPESDLMKYLVSQRDRLRDFHRRAVEAVANNNMSDLIRIKEEYRKVYPELGELKFRKQDIRAVHLRHDVSRVERLLETMPAESRALFGPMIGVALGEQAEQFLGVDPAFLGGGTILSRRIHRQRPTSGRTKRVKEHIAPSPTRTSRFGAGIRPDQTGTIKRPSVMSGFEGFKAFGD